MSYMRCSGNLRFFKSGKSELYVFGTLNEIEGYGELPTCDDKNLIELIGRFIYHIELEYAPKTMTYTIVKELANRMGYANDLRDYEEIFDENGHWVD